MKLQSAYQQNFVFIAAALLLNCPTKRSTEVAVNETKCQGLKLSKLLLSSVNYTTIMTAILV